MRYGLDNKVYSTLNSEESLWWKGKKTDHGYTINFKEPPPVLIMPCRDIIAAMVSTGNLGAFERVDHDIVEWVWKNNRLKVISNSEEFFWVEFCKDGRNYPTIMNDYWTNGARHIFKTDLLWHL